MVHSELEKIIANRNSFDRFNFIKAGIISCISIAISIFVIEFLFPQILKAQDRLPRPETIRIYLHVLAGAYAVGSIYLTQFLGADFKESDYWHYSGRFCLCLYFLLKNIPRAISGSIVGILGFDWIYGAVYLGWVFHKIKIDSYSIGKSVTIGQSLERAGR